MEEILSPEESVVMEDTRQPEMPEEYPAPKQPEMPEPDPVPELLPARKKRKWWLIPVCLVLALAIAAGGAYLFTADLRQYTQALELLDAGQYTEAQALFEDLGDYKDAAHQVSACRYAQAGELVTDKQYAEALAIYEALGDFEYSPRKVQECSYNLAEAALEAGDLDTAIDYFTKATDDYRDAKVQRLDATYQRGHDLYMKGQYEQAQTYFDLLGDYAGFKPHFVTFDEALEYILSQAPTLPEEVRVVVKDMPGTYILRSDLLNATVQQRLGYQFAEVDYSEKTGMLSVKPSYYPGQKIVYAMKTNDFSKLTDEELDAYDNAMAVVERAKAECDDLEAVELWLHDWLCQRVEYDSPYEYVYPEDFVGLDELTCVGALRDGKANCQGYTDAFYLLGSMAGLEMYVIFGAAEGGGHCWNGVRLDGKTYTVDVTFDDTYIQDPEHWTYIWYNNTLDLDSYSVSGGSTLFPNMVTRKDLSKTYYTQQGMVFEELSDAAYQLLRQFRENGAGLYHAVVDAPNLTDDDFYRVVAANVMAADVYSVRWWVGLETYEEDTYITVYFE